MQTVVFCRGDFGLKVERATLIFQPKYRRMGDWFESGQVHSIIRSATATFLVESGSPPTVCVSVIGFSALEYDIVENVAVTFSGFTDDDIEDKLVRPQGIQISGVGLSVMSTAGWRTLKVSKNR